MNKNESTIALQMKIVIIIIIIIIIIMIIIIIIIIIIQTERKIEHNKPDVVLLDKSKKVCFVLDVTCPFDTRVIKKEKEKIEFYTDLKYEILKCWKHEVEKLSFCPLS